MTARLHWTQRIFIDTRYSHVDDVRNRSIFQLAATRERVLAGATNVQVRTDDGSTPELRLST
ncbi:hypothetical protein MMUC44124_16760 [Mycolicibacterium mucogenicum DSM 44124]|uniref:Uncharacterized protein n=1 Tax=Mycolicibacterium mucogenicum DSM 44124 TaxID=1226753 RepID=A0A8H2PGI1_MYCMU|nr:hypothetical protein MMUC44124_16760 [Mycolicibacterium mucogenicum DSM 44124]